MKVTIPSLDQNGIQLAAAAYACGIVCILPLYSENGLIQLVSAKWHMFFFSTCAALVIMCVLALYHRFHQRKPLRRFVFKPSRISLTLVFMLLTYTVSTLFSHMPERSFWGLDSRMNGWLMFALCTACYFLICTLISSNQILLICNAMIIGASLSCLVAWLNLFCIDPLGYYSYIPQHARHQFISTVGNINFFGALLCLAAPYALYQALFSSSHRFWYQASAVFLLSSFLVANSDGPWLALACGTCVILLNQKLGTLQAKRLFFVGGLCCSVWLFAGILIRIVPIYAPMRTISSVLCHPLVACCGILGCAGMWLLFDKTKLSARLFFRSIFAGGIVIALLLLAVCNLWNVSLGPLNGLLQFGPQWGSNRGYVWGILVDRYYYTFNYREQLFGIGPDLVTHLLNPVYSQKIIAMNGTAFDSAHNEFLQMLICCGLFGLFFWLLFIFSHIKHSLYSTPYLTASLVAYCVQSFFSIHFVGVFPIFFALCALTAVKKSKK